ncbi:MAG: translation initiation factor IF-2 [Planctomycetota bacterium]
MAKRVFEIAKDIGIPSKEIVAKCHAEGIPADVIKNHMSSVSVGLEATIRDWFSGGGGEDTGGGTAVETSAKVDVQRIRAKAKPKAKAKAKAAPAEPAEPIETTGSGTPESPEPAVEQPAAPTPTAAPTPIAAPVPGAPSTPPAPTKIGAPAVPAASAPVETAPPPAAEQAAAEPEVLLTAEPESSAGTGDAPAATKTVDAAPGREESGQDASGGGATPTADDGRPARPAIVKPNVPSRPKVIAPAGPQLQTKTPVKLSGPKVVRVEAPEPVETRRPRPSGPGGGGWGGPRGPRPGGGGAGPGMMPPPGEGGDRRRRGGNKRRNDEGDRSDGGGGGGDRAGWSQQDLAEREARLQRSGGYMRQRRQQLRRQQQMTTDRPATPAVQGGKVTISEPFTIKDLSAATGVKGADIVKKLFMSKGVMATINSGIDTDQAQEIMMDWEIELEVVEAKTAEQQVKEEFAERETVDERPRGPVVTILGHVDHGKTSLLDRIRNANVAEGEAGGITQATSAFRVGLEVGGEQKQVVFLDTPGHEAFTSMRSRGANMTDLVVLVVAADDGVMPQTIESINHTKAAGVPLVVALNKIDKAEATDSNIQRILAQLAEHDLNPVEWGGDTEVMRVSAHTGDGIPELLEVLDYQAELLELKADFGGPARGTVIESRHEEGRGAVANILVQDGELKVGDFVVAGRGFGRVRDITDDRGTKVKQSLPPQPVQISGLDELPDAGDHFFIVKTLKKAQEAAEQRRERERETQLSQPKVTLDTMFSRMADAELKEILVVLKADVQGSVDVLRNEIEKVTTDEVKVRVLHSAVGGITESDVLLADASRAIIIGFNVIASSKARKLADDKSIEIRNYQVIYDITDDVRKAAEGLLEPELRQEVLGHAEVRQVFKVSKVGSIAGCYVTDGVVQRDAFIRVTRGDIVIENDRVLEQLKRFKDDAKEVRSGMECGMKIVGYDDIKEGDILECYKEVEVKRSL